MRLSRTLLSAGTAVAALATASALRATSAMAQDQKPKIMLIMGDDIGWLQPSSYHRGRLRMTDTPTV